MCLIASSKPCMLLVQTYLSLSCQSTSRFQVPFSTASSVLVPLFLFFWPPVRPVFKVKVFRPWAHHTEEVHVGMRNCCKKKKKKSLSRLVQFCLYLTFLSQCVLLPTYKKIRWPCDRSPHTLASLSIQLLHPYWTKRPSSNVLF